MYKINKKTLFIFLCGISTVIQGSSFFCCCYKRKGLLNDQIKSNQKTDHLPLQEKLVNVQANLPEIKTNKSTTDQADRQSYNYSTNRMRSGSMDSAGSA
ncbi:MAG: hypothetical protein ACXWL2_04675 [Candidatus Chromulinivorax sp.]